MTILFNECIKVTLNFRMQFESFEKEGPLGAQLVIRCVMPIYFTDKNELRLILATFITDKIAFSGKFLF